MRLPQPFDNVMDDLACVKQLKLDINNQTALREPKHKDAIDRVLERWTLPKGVKVYRYGTAPQNSTIVRMFCRTTCRRLK